MQCYDNKDETMIIIASFTAPIHRLNKFVSLLEPHWTPYN